MSGPLPKIFSPVTVPASWLYGCGIRLRNVKFDRGRGVEHIGRPVISIGNLTTGGTGKTPMVTWLARRLSELNHRPVIAMRGYGAKADSPADEHLEYETQLPNVPIVAHPDRTSALRTFFARRAEHDCVILDDGFQHRQLHRDLDVVLIDATRPALDDRLLPAGHLREPPESLARADAVVITRAEGTDDLLIARVERYHRRPPIAWTRHTWSRLRVIENGDERIEDTSWLNDRRLLTMVGTGNPQPVLDQFERHGAKIAVNIPLRDHDPYERSTIIMARGMSDGVDAVGVTMKDWVKISRHDDARSWSAPFVVPELEIEFVVGEEEFMERVAGVFGSG